jgi:hypothetical protein
VQFVRELSRIDTIKSQNVSHQIVNVVVSSKYGHLAHFVYGLSEAGHIFTEEEKNSLWHMSNVWLERLEQAAPQHGGMHEQLAGVYSQIGRLLAPINSDRSLQLFENAHRHANLETNTGVRLQARIHVLKNLLMCQDVELWKRAITYSLDFGEAVFETFTWFGHDLLEFGDEDQPYHLLQTIHWAENVMDL